MSFSSPFDAKKYQFKFLVETISKIHLATNPSNIFDDIGFDGDI
jgi:hypothetical protein